MGAWRRPVRQHVPVSGRSLRPRRSRGAAARVATCASNVRSARAGTGCAAAGSSGTLQNTRCTRLCVRFALRPPTTEDGVALEMRCGHASRDPTLDCTVTQVLVEYDEKNLDDFIALADAVEVGRSQRASFATTVALRLTELTHCRMSLWTSPSTATRGARSRGADAFSVQIVHLASFACDS